MNRDSKKGRSALPLLFQAAVAVAFTCGFFGPKIAHVVAAHAPGHTSWVAGDAAGGGLTIRGADPVGIGAMTAAGFVGMAIGGRRRRK